MLASRFGRGAHSFRSETPLSDDQLRRFAPSIFAEEAHESRSERYTYIPTSFVLQGLRKEGFEPFMVCQTRVRDEGKREFTKHMVRMRHASQINDREANEIVLLNSHDGSSSYQMLAGLYRFVCSNGLVCGDTVADVRVRHKGQIVENVVEAAYDVKNSFELVRAQRDAMRTIDLNPDEVRVFARAALELKYDTAVQAPPITEEQVIRPRRHADVNSDLWSTFNVAQENLLRGGLVGRNAKGQRRSTREVQGIDQGIKLNRALWTLAEGMRMLKA